jgi:hypothetical protein
MGLYKNGFGSLGLLVRSHSPCSAELISMAYQPWYSIFLSQQNSHSRLISRRNSLPNRVIFDVVLWYDFIIKATGSTSMVLHRRL